MALRLSLAAVIVAYLIVACGDSTSAPTGTAGASTNGVIFGSAGSIVGGATASSGAAGVSRGGVGGIGVAGASAGLGGVNAPDRAGAGQSTSGGQGGISASGGSGGAAISVGGGAGASTSAAGSAGMEGGVPPGWIMVTDVDYSKVPGPNFDTVRLMFKGAQCSGSSCHFGGRNHFQMGKTADALYSYMMSFQTLECGKLIDTANPAQSALVKYLRGPCGDLERMPQYTCVDDGDEACVPEYYIQAIQQWIANGAPR